MTNKTTTFSAPSKTKIKHILLIIVVVALACYFVPLPIPPENACVMAKRSR